ncbi:hypothetical protein [Paracidovorax sp. MALMAid1276]|uniref:hypothetical protein n=1 Tax=Paracidovorax sp. MALMAid1276 TaxID=3411631 RepID=UPI003B9C0B8D
MNTPTPPHVAPVRAGYSSADAESGMYDIRIFWLAALAAVLMVLVVAHFKMGY